MFFPARQPFRKKTNWLLAAATEALAHPLRTYARARTGPPTPPESWRRALILGDNHIGDLLYRSASLEALRRGLPNCAFYYLAAPGSAEILQGHPAIREVLPWLRSDSTLDLAPERLDELKALGFDAALCTNCVKYWPELLLAVRLGIPNRAGYIYKGFSGWVTHPMPLRYPDSYPGYFRDYVAGLTGQRPDWPLRPVIYSEPRHEAEAAALWREMGFEEGAEVVASFVTSRQPAGVWPAEKFGATLQALKRLRQTQIVLCGASSDESTLRQINAEFQLGAHVLAGRLSLRSLHLFLRRCSLVLSTDSGPRHIANASGVPVAFVRNVWSNAVETGVYLETELDLCEPPSQSGPVDGDGLLKMIEPERAAEQLAQLLARGCSQPAGKA